MLSSISLLKPICFRGMNRSFLSLYKRIFIDIWILGTFSPSFVNFWVFRKTRQYSSTVDKSTTLENNVHAHYLSYLINHYNDVIMTVIASQITSLTIVNSTIYWRRRSNKESKLRVTGLCAGNWPVTGEFPAQRARNVENVSILWRHHVMHVRIHTRYYCYCTYDLITKREI